MELPSSIQEIYKQSECLYTKEEVEHALDKLAGEISQKLGDKNPILLCVMIGGLVPVGNLLLRLDFPLSLHYVHATRYRGATTGQDLQWRMHPSCDIRDRTVLIIDDILDSGITLAAIAEHCQEQQAQEIYTAVLVNKLCTRSPIGLEKADFVGLTVEDRYVFGYGLDYHDYLRNAPGIFVVPKEYE